MTTSHSDGGMDARRRATHAARLHKRAQLHRTRSIGCDPQGRALELDIAERLTRIARLMEAGTLPPIRSGN